MTLSHAQIYFGPQMGHGPCILNAKVLFVVKKIGAREILDSDIEAVLELLRKGFEPRSRAFWLEVLTRLPRYSVPAQMPKYGYLLESDGGPVGVILLISAKVQTAIGDGVMPKYFKGPSRPRLGDLAYTETAIFGV